jgi:hypothetical protein
VLHDVAQSFLRDPKQAQRHVFWKLSPDVIVDKLNSQVVLF